MQNNDPAQIAAVVVRSEINQFIEQAAREDLSFPEHRGRKGIGVGGSLPRSSGSFPMSNERMDRLFSEGGATVKVVGADEEPLTGYVVAQHPEMGAIVESPKQMDRKELRDKIKQYARRHRDLLSQDGMYLGLWVNDADGNLYLDIPTVMQDRALAVQAGADADQIAIWDIANKTEIPTHGSGKKGEEI